MNSTCLWYSLRRHIYSVRKLLIPRNWNNADLEERGLRTWREKQLDCLWRARGPSYLYTNGKHVSRGLLEPQAPTKDSKNTVLMRRSSILETYIVRKCRSRRIALVIDVVQFALSDTTSWSTWSHDWCIWDHIFCRVKLLKIRYDFLVYWSVM